MLLLTLAKGLGIDDDLMLLVYRSQSIVALDRALLSGHLGRFIIGDVAFDFLASLTLAHPWALRL